MSNTNLQTQTSNALHNAIMEAGGKDRPPMLAPGSSETTEGYMENYKNVSQDIRDQLNAEAEAVQIILIGIDNDIYSTEFGKFTSQDGESLESYYSKFYKMMNELVRNQCDVTNHQVNVQFLLQLQPEWQRFMTLVKQKPTMVAEDDEMSKENEIDKLMALITLSFKKIYKPTNKNLKTSSNTSRANQDNTLRINRGTRHVARECHKSKRAKDAAYNKEKMLLYDADNSRPIFDAEPLQKVQNNDDNYNVFAIESEHPEQPESANDTYLVEQDEHNIIIDSLDLSYDREHDDQYDNDRTEYYYADHMNAILGVYTTLDEFTNLQCDYLETLEKCKHLEKELSKSKTMSKSFEGLQKHAINLELDLQQCKEQIKNDKAFKENQSKVFLKEREQYFEIQDLKAQLQDKGIAISELKKLIEKMKGKSVETKFEKSSVIRQPNAFKSQRQSVLGVIPTTSVSRPQLKSNQLEDRVMHNDSQGKKQQVEDHHRNFKFSNNKTFLTACNDSLNAKTSNVNFFTPSGYKWKPKSPIGNVNTNVSMHLGNESKTADILESMTPRCSKHMTGNLKLLRNVTIKMVYYVKGLNHNLFFVGQFCDADLEVAFRKSTCYIHDLNGNDLLIGSRGTDLYSIILQDTSTPNPICLMAKATSSQAWLWHRRLSHLNFDTINFLSKYDIVTGLPKLKFVKDHLCSSCELGKEKRKSFKTKTTPSSKRRLQILHMDLCGPMRVESFNDETPEVLIDFLKLVQRGLHAQFSLMFDELLNGTTQVVSKSFAVTTADAPNKRQQQNTTQSTTTTVAADIPPLIIQTTPQTTNQVPTITSIENINQAKTDKENAQVEEDEFINIFSTPVQE
ncbi:retrovirus-related pol polyprotein from transposon TNT 1-94 [Tanacetum coccineum]